MVFCAPGFKKGLKSAVPNVLIVLTRHPMAVPAQALLLRPMDAANICVPFTKTAAVSSAKTEREAFVTMPSKRKLCANKMFVPFGNTTYPGADGFPVEAVDTQEEPVNGAAQAGLFAMFIVALPPVFVVFAAELANWIIVALDVGAKEIVRNDR